ncbi:alanine racemase [Candidatus Pacearchaeota archaeon]|nr:MAG: alanine racemase [Candidatus Pacearchaeota archaeon]
MILWYKKLEINLYNLKKNLQALKKFLSSDIKILPVIKNDAYGHGLIEVAKTLSEENVFGFGLSEPLEAYYLRKAGFVHPILLLSGFEKDWISEMRSLKIIPVVTNMKQFEWLSKFTKEKLIKWEFHLKIDTGMHRFGLPVEEIKQFIEKLKNTPQLQLTGIMTHFSAAEHPDSEITQFQLKLFKKSLKLFYKYKIFPKYVHFANSAGIIFFSEKGNLVRPGISLFGSYPCNEAYKYIKLFPVMTLKSKIVEIKKLKKGESAGYGPTFYAKKDTILGLIPVGYGDGYLRSLSNKGFAYYRNKRVPVVGTISMKALYIDLNEIENPKIGEEVILLGGKNNEVPADELAQLAGTISYEIFCSIGKSIPKEYKTEKC